MKKDKFAAGLNEAAAARGEATKPVEKKRAPFTSEQLEALDFKVLEFSSRGFILPMGGEAKRDK